MKKMFRNISLIMMTILVVFLSMGVNISKMQCDKAGRVYIGTEVPSCNTEKDIICVDKQELPCCFLEIKKPCCPETMDNSCSSDSRLIQFDFETLVESTEEIITLTPTVFSLCFISAYCHTNSLLNLYISDIPPQKLNKPLLAQLQTFLL